MLGNTKGARVLLRALIALCVCGLFMGQAGALAARLLRGGGMALTLLKSSTYPNPEADLELHRFTYAIMPHCGGWRDPAAALALLQIQKSLQSGACRV